MISRRRTPAALILLAILGVTGCAQPDSATRVSSESTTPAPAASSAVPTSSPVAVAPSDEEGSEEGSQLSGLPASVAADALRTADGFLGQYLDRTLTSKVWVAGLVPYSTPMMVENLIGTEPTNIPFTRYAPLRLDDAPTMNNVRVIVETEDAGTWTLLLMRQRSAEKFLVGEIEMPEGTR